VTDPSSPGKIQKFRYKGPSMLPTFKPGQMLYIRPEQRAIKPGDVVVFQKENEYIVHRVVSVTPEGISTRGDNNPHGDPWLLTPDQVLGVVEKAEDWDKAHAVRGGKTALLQAKARWTLKTVCTRSLPWLGAPYRWLKAKGWVKKIWHPPVTQVQLQTNEGTMIKYVVRGKTVANWYPRQQRFLCRRPYDLVITPPTK